MKQRIFEIISVAGKGDKLSKIFDITIISLIFINLFIAFLDTFTLSSNITKFYYTIEIISIIIFTIEYLLRIWTTNLLYPDKSRSMAIIKYIFSFSSIIDLLAILPFYMQFFFPYNLLALRSLRLLRMFRVLKINRYSKAFNKLADVFKQKKDELLVSIFVISLLIIISSILIYNFENPAQPDVFKNAFSGIWWSIATFTTIGYGDIYPITTMGKILSSIIAFLGIALVAVPTGIITSGFNQKIEKEASTKTCPNCGYKNN